MSNNSDISYLKIGIFILTGLIFFVAAILLFGSNKLFQHSVYIETYFEESVQGISEGYPVKYRGLQIGYVKKIAFTNEVYPQQDAIKPDKIQSRSIYILLAITSKLFTNLSKDEIRDFLNREIIAGLRVKIMPQGLTGTTYIELNYVDPQSNPPLPITWRPRYFYIPSSPGMLTKLGDNAQYILNEIKNMDLKKLYENINTLTNSLDHVAQKTDQLITKTDGPIEKTLKNFQEVSQNLRILSEQIKLYPSQILFSGAPPPIDPGKL